MKIERAQLLHCQLDLVHPFRTSFGETRTRDLLLIRLQSEGVQGWGEAPVTAEPGYSYETIGTAWHVLESFFLPALLGEELPGPVAMADLLAPFRGHPMARAGLELALWDLQGQRDRVSLKDLLGGQRDRVPVGVSIGLQPSLELLLARVQAFVELGYLRIKIKIKPGEDIELVREVRRQFPNLGLQVDANAAYTMDQAGVLEQLDRFRLAMIEQPFAAEDLLSHRQLQAQLNTPICLDESVGSALEARQALELEACRVINIKQARVGGLAEAVKIHDLCRQASIPVWCGGLLESGVGRAANLALASLPGFTLPGDISATERYYRHDLAKPEFTLEAGHIRVPESPGLGVEIDEDMLAAHTVNSKWLRPD